MSSSITVDWDDLARQLRAAGVDAEAAEVHGEFCGRACLRGVAAIRSWQQALLPDADTANVPVSECNRSLEILAADSLLKLEAGDLQFNLLLPGDDESLQHRAVALADWCQGFMHGLVEGGAADQGYAADLLDEALPDEILDDFSEITKAGAAQDEGEEAEQAFAELVEYVRVSAQLIYDELAVLRATPDSASTRQ